MDVTCSKNNGREPDGDTSGLKYKIKKDSKSINAFYLKNRSQE